MATAQTKPVAGVTDDPSESAPPPVLYSGEAMILVATLGIGMLALGGLVLANAGRYSLASALALAVAGAAGVAVVAWRAGRPRLATDGRGLAVLAGTAALAAVLFLPGFAYGVGKDPGAYVTHAIAIARVGSSGFDDPVQERVPRVEVQREDPTRAMAMAWVT